MKVLVHFEPLGNKLDYFEGARLRKTIKGALEVSNIKYTTAIMDTFDIAHFISPNDDLKIHYALETKSPIVVSALYTEDDDSARFLEHKVKRDGTRKTTLKLRALRMLNNASLVLVPTSTQKDMLINFGVTSEIQVSFPSVNLSRFSFTKTEERDIFYRYFGESKNKKIVIAMGGSTPAKEGIGAFIEAAKANPEASFYYIGSCKEKDLKRQLRKEIKRSPKNAKYVGVLTDDLHRSALINADVLLLPGYVPIGAISVCEAMAAKCQIIARESALPFDVLEDGKEAYIASFSETLVYLVTDYLNGKLQPTVDNAYELIKSRNLEQFGKELKEIYERQLSLKKIGGK